MTKRKADKGHFPQLNTDFTSWPELNPDDYRQYLAEFDMTKEQEDEFIEALWHILNVLIDKAFGMDSTQLAKGSKMDEIDKKEDNSQV